MTGRSDRPTSRTRPTERRYPPGFFVILVVMAVAAGLLGWRVVASGTSADRAARSADRATRAAEDLADVLNRRAPTLEYLSCRDEAELPFEAAQAEFLLALFDQAALERAEPPDPAAIAEAARRVARARDGYDRARRQLLAVNDPAAPLEAEAAPGEPHRCPSIPLPGGGR